MLHLAALDMTNIILFLIIFKYSSVNSYVKFSNDYMNKLVKSNIAAALSTIMSFFLLNLLKISQIEYAL